MLLLHKIKYLYKFSMQTQHYIAFISLHNSQLVIHPGENYSIYNKLNFYLHVFMRRVEYAICYIGAVGGKYVTCFNKSCTPKVRANDSGQTWIIRLVFILNQ